MCQVDGSAGLVLGMVFFIYHFIIDHYTLTYRADRAPSRALQHRGMATMATDVFVFSIVLQTSFKL